MREDLAVRALDLARMLRAAARRDREVLGLLALLMVNHARRGTRTDAGGRPLRLAEQDRSAWDRAAIAEGDRLVVAALAAGPPGRFALQAAIAALHAQAPSYAETDWAQIVDPVRALLRRLAVPGGRAQPRDRAGRGRRARRRRSRRSSALEDGRAAATATCGRRRRSCSSGSAGRRRRSRPTAPRSTLADNAAERAFLTERLSETDR